MINRSDHACTYLPFRRLSRTAYKHHSNHQTAWSIGRESGMSASATEKSRLSEIFASRLRMGSNTRSIFAAFGHLNPPPLPKKQHLNAGRTFPPFLDVVLLPHVRRPLVLLVHVGDDALAQRGICLPRCNVASRIQSFGLKLAGPFLSIPSVNLSRHTPKSWYGPSASL
jgi:hypothetical protein